MAVITEHRWTSFSVWKRGMWCCNIFILSYTVFWSSVQCWYHPPLHRETGKLHLWPTWFDFVKCVPSLGQLLISPLLLFIMFESVNKRRRMRETSVRIKGGGGLGGWVDRIKSITVACWGEMVLSSLASQCVTANLVQLSQSLPSPPTHSLSLCFLCLFPLLVPVLPNPWAVWLEYQWISLY